MKTEVKIILYPEEHKSKNGPFFEELIRNIMETQRYEIVPNINFTGLEIDLMATHKDRDEKAYIECKAREKVNSSELKNFVFSVSDHKVNYGYFIHTVELDHQAAGLKEKLKNDPDKRYKHIIFLGPDKIIELLIEIKRIKRIDWTEIEVVENIHKLILAYTYFGIYYIVIPLEGTKTAKYYLFDARTGEQIPDAGAIADKEHSANTSIHNALKSGIKELENLKHAKFDKEMAEKPVKESTGVDALETETKENSKPRLLFLFPDPIDKNFGYEFHDLTRSFIRCDVEVDCMYLSEKTLECLDEYNYAFIFTRVYKNKIYVEDEIFKSKLLSVKDFEQALFTDDRTTKGIFLFTPEKIDFKGIITDKPIVNIVSNHEKLKKDLPQLRHHLFSKQEYKGNFDFNFFNKGKIQIVRFNKTSEKFKPHIIKTELPDLIDPKTLQNFVGRKVDQ